MKKFLKTVLFVIVAIIVIGLTAWSEQAIAYPIVRTMLAAWTMTAVVVGISIMTQKFKAMSRVLLAFIPSFGIIPWVVKSGCCLTVLAEVLFVLSRITEVKIVDNKILVQ